MVMNLSEVFSLLESVSLSDSEVEAIFKDCLNKLESIGPEFSLNNNNNDLKLQVEGFTATTILGQCHIDSSGNQIYQSIQINRLIYKEELKDILINNIYHEMCHYYQNRDYIKSGDWFIENGELRGSDEIKRIHIEENGGHGPSWLKYANKVNEVLKPKILLSARANNLEVDAIAASDAPVSAIIKCPNGCSTINIYDRDIYDFEMEPDLLNAVCSILLRGVTCKKCGKNVEIEFKDKNLEKEILAQLSKFVFAEMLRKFTSHNSISMPYNNIEA